MSLNASDVTDNPSSGLYFFYFTAKLVKLVIFLDFSSDSD